MSKPALAVIGSLNMDIIVESVRFPKIGETILGNSVSYIPGGKGANQAVAASRLGAHTVMIGAIGDDINGHALRDSLARENICTDSLKLVKDVPTGIASIIRSNGNNQIVVVPGANSFLLPEDIYLHKESIQKVDIVLIQLEIPLETVVYSIELAKGLGKTVVLNPAPARKLPAEVYHKVDYVTPNESELEFLTGVCIETESLEKAMRVLSDMGVPHVIATLGGNGAAYQRQGEEMVRLPGYDVPVKDTTGAGDAFNAGFSYALATEKDVITAIQFANKVGALSVTRDGAQSSMPYLEEIVQFNQL